MRYLRLTGTAFGLSLVLVATVWAAEHGHGGEADALAAWKDFGWRILNFALFAFIIYKLGGQKIKDFFGSRRQQIASQLSDLEARKGEAQKKLQEVEKSIANLKAEQQEVLEQARAQGEAMKEAILKKAREDAEKIKAQAKVKADQELQHVIEGLKDELADLIIESAEKMIVAKLGKKEQERLIDEYLTKVVLN